MILADEESRSLWLSPDVVERVPFDDAGLFVPLPAARMSHAAATKE